MHIALIVFLTASTLFYVKLLTALIINCWYPSFVPWTLMPTALIGSAVILQVGLGALNSTRRIVHMHHVRQHLRVSVSNLYYSVFLCKVWNAKLHNLYLYTPIGSAVDTMSLQAATDSVACGGGFTIVTCWFLSQSALFYALNHN